MIELRVRPGLEAAAGLAAVKLIAVEHPGEHRLCMVILGPGGPATPLAQEDDAGARRLTLGPEWRYSGSSDCLAALGEYGEAKLVPLEN